VRRREVFKGIAATSLLTALPGSARAALARKEAVMRRVRPSDPAWPKPAEWAELNARVGGTLIRPRALFAGCEQDATSAACREIERNTRNPIYLGDQPAGTEVSGWLDAWTPATSAYALKARNAIDVAAAVNFAREHRLRLVVKGGGHSYQGTSNAADSLLIWTRAMKKIVLHDAFTPQGCEGLLAPAPAVTTETGAMWIDLYHAVTSEAGRYVQGGGCCSVGCAGLVQSGGFGSFSKGFGTAAASLLEAEVVTADGRVRTVNARKDPDLFWALKGGGGGSWGVVTRMTLRTHDLPKYFGAALGAIEAKSDADYRALIARFMEFYAGSLLNPHWGEHAAFGPDNTLGILMVSQGLDDTQNRAVWQPFLDSIRSEPHRFTVSGEFRTAVLSARHWWDVAQNPGLTRDTQPGDPPYYGWWQGDSGQVGAFLHGYDSLWLPSSLLSGAGRDRLVEAMFAASRHKGFQFHFNKGIAGARAEAAAATRETATHPAVLSAFALAIIADYESSAYPGEPRAAVDLTAARQDAQAIARAAAELRKLVPGAGSYVSESNYFNREWQSAYWGHHYPRLRAIKERYDPDGLFFGHNGVGSEDWSVDGFTRLRWP
jgi:FAD/FMN-containing dehydrogenase